MSAETMKMPEPIIEPTTTAVASKRPRPRVNSPSSSVDLVVVEVIVAGFARREQADEREHPGRRQIVADVLQSVAVAQPRRDVRRERCAEDARQVEGQRAARIADR